MQKRTDTISKEEYLKVANELDELKAFKDIPSTKIEDIKTNLDKVSGNSLTERMQTLKELKPDLFVQEQQSVSPTNFINICNKFFFWYYDLAKGDYLIC
ncbi:hypothetical protein M1771_04760 [Spiroplasma citri]|uniref:Uncharacterized protein n=1 Tax=Spiroplasma citri TaxID=2133 RepID=A0AAX3T1K8_SPICI|nr:hypothetical protein [Spiroplasma citri]WFG97312.1 hypothetical protein M0C40_04780 [Spiroplasma citri]WFH01210.1 hypothetical protein M1771_04760 [Spiroplasma citri]